MSDDHQLLIEAEVGVWSILLVTHEAGLAERIIQ
jgi:hypothetical protein